MTPLGSHIGKVFCSVLNARLSEVMESKILGEAQKFEDEGSGWF